MRAPQRAGLLAPLTGFLLVFFVLPLGWLLSLAVREAEVPRALPRTLAVLSHGRRPRHRRRPLFLRWRKTSWPRARRRPWPMRRGASTTPSTACARR